MNLFTIYMIIDISTKLSACFAALSLEFEFKEKMKSR